MANSAKFFGRVGNLRASLSASSVLFGILGLLGLLGWTASTLPLAFGGNPGPVEVEVADAPSNDYTLLLKSIQGAERSITVNIYELTSPEIANALQERIDAGIHVEILEEGQPVGGMSADGRAIQRRLVQSMRNAVKNQRARDHFYEMTSRQKGNRIKRRYRFDHAKYAVIDSSRVLIGSENYSPSGHPAPSTVGNRGWEVLVKDVALARQFEALFEADRDTQWNDVHELVQGSFPTHPTHLEVQLPIVYSQTNNPPTHPTQKLPSSKIVPVFSPESSQPELLRLIDQAERALDIEQMTFDSAWSEDQLPVTSPLIQAVIRAAHRGVKVRVLLNDETVFDHPGHPAAPKNKVTVDLLTDQARIYGLPLQARIAKIQDMGVKYIHNKGLLVDGETTLVSSINWNQNSILKNREAAVILFGREINAYYRGLFESDWNVSAPKEQNEFQQLARKFFNITK